MFAQFPLLISGASFSAAAYKWLYLDPSIASIVSLVMFATLAQHCTEVVLNQTLVEHVLGLDGRTWLWIDRMSAVVLAVVIIHKYFHIVLISNAVKSFILALAICAICDALPSSSHIYIFLHTIWHFMITIILYKFCLECIQYEKRYL